MSIWLQYWSAASLQTAKISLQEKQFFLQTVLGAWFNAVPRGPTKVFFGSRIDSAYAASGERYTDSETAFAYRKALRADCTCNGHNPGGLAPSRSHAGRLAAPGRHSRRRRRARRLFRHPSRPRPNPDFTPVASFPGLDAGRAHPLEAI
jgi:hypothetical protein